MSTSLLRDLSPISLIALKPAGKVLHQILKNFPNGPVNNLAPNKNNSKIQVQHLITPSSSHITPTPTAGIPPCKELSSPPSECPTVVNLNPNKIEKREKFMKTTAGVLFRIGFQEDLDLEHRSTDIQIIDSFNL
ncbi:unnamed protein product [Lepeophtheirus salmonis]|uniref:(salmon louse) hypothetical protein n=1 Tax=Lepeophtheirus salmonis TaxID=72036 RepID=A0A7R8D5T8_LEPSM|nr:unnamed protein product [Lepeophtheirus salmonis]CAF3007871.1 unnamed protein product [Lepeophtheirus salmonis]